MPEIAAIAVVAVFALLALVHVYWALGGQAGSLGAVPEVHERPAFVPTASATFSVAIGLVACAVLVAASAGLVVSKVPATWVTWMAYALAFVLLARAVGDFRLVGFFKRVRGTRFARLDSAVYAPLCLILALAVFYVAYVHQPSA
jgi:Protein of unknown function (DUF3995)